MTQAASGLAASRAALGRGVVEDLAERAGRHAPRVALQHVAPRQPAAAQALGAVGGGRDDRVLQVGGVVRRHEPPGRPVVDDLGGAAAVDGDHRQLAGHGLDEHLPEALVDRRQHHDVAGAKQVRERPWGCQPASSTASAPRRLIASAGCSPSHSPGCPPTMTSEIPPPMRLRARVKASISSGTRLTSVKRPT